MESLVNMKIKEASLQKADGELELEDDPAKFLFEHSEYHDCYFMVGDPASESLEKIGVVSANLAAHSPVFRAMLSDKNVDKTKINVAGVTPVMFKLMLTHMYGGALPMLDLPRAAQLALCADMYLIQPLVDRVCELLVPKCVAEVFPALWCVAYILCPNLWPHVSKIIQEETGAVIASSQFFKLDAKCLEFITKQEQLAITELELWKGLVKWAKKKVQIDHTKTMRQYLQPALQYVRLPTLSQEEIIKEVMPTKILTSTELVELLTAVTSNQDWECPGLYKTNKVRGISEDASNKKNESTAESKTNSEKQTLIHTDSIFNNIRTWTVTEHPQYQTISNFTLNILKDIELNSFTFKTRSLSSQANQPIYYLSCTITISQIEKCFYKDKHIIQIKAWVLSGKSVDFPLKLGNGQPLRLETNISYFVALEFSTPHPVFYLGNRNVMVCQRPLGRRGITCISKTDLKNRNVFDSNNLTVMTIKYNTATHVERISFKS